MENEIEKKENAEDEISLLDLFAVLIRNRKLIFFGTAIVTFLAIIWLFVIPLVFKKSNKKLAVVTYTVEVQNIPNIISAKLPNRDRISPLYLATYNCQRQQFLVDHLKDNNIFSEAEMDPYGFNTFVQQLVKDGKIKVSSSPLGNAYDIILKINIDKVEDAGELIKSIVKDTETSIEDYYTPLLKTLEQNTNNSLEKANSVVTNILDMSTLQNLQDLIVELEEFQQSFTSFLTLRENPFIVPEARGRVKKLVIVFLAAFFVFVFAAFCKNAIANIKADPDSSKLISDAWQAGK